MRQGANKSRNIQYIGFVFCFISEHIRLTSTRSMTKLPKNIKNENDLFVYHLLFILHIKMRVYDQLFYCYLKVMSCVVCYDKLTISSEETTSIS